MCSILKIESIAELWFCSESNCICVHSLVPRHWLGKTYLSPDQHLGTRLMWKVKHCASCMVSGTHHPACLYCAGLFGYFYATLPFAIYCIAGDVTIDSMELTVDSDLYGESPQFTLTCVSTGGPATNVTWNKNSSEILMGMTVLNNTVTAQYNHKLTVTGRLPGRYQCTIFNNKPSTATANFTVQGGIRIQHSLHV